MMSALTETKKIANDINLVYELTEKPNYSQLTAHADRAVLVKISADLLLPTDKILTVEIDFNNSNGYHDNAVLVMDDFGVELLASAFEVKYGKQYAENIRAAWAEKQQPDDPRKPSYLLVQKPKDETSLPQVFAVCGSKDHKENNVPKTIV
jgi:hypothetical protein